MIPDNVCIWCHSFWRNDLFQPLFQAVPGVILFGSMRLYQHHLEAFPGVILFGAMRVADIAKKFS
jgi:hypothetical protein